MTAVSAVYIPMHYTGVVITRWCVRFRSLLLGQTISVDFQSPVLLNMYNEKKKENFGPLTQQ
jgi:hypothetical protein